MTSQSLLLTCSSLSILLLLLHFSPTSLAICPPSSCGIIHNISSPFRLEADPQNCGDARFELACEDNVTSFYLNSHKYYVKELYYNSTYDDIYIYTIKLVDASINNDDICSFPTVNFLDIMLSDPPYSLYDDYPYPINFIRCPQPLKNSSLFTEIPTYCASNYTHIKVGGMRPSEVPHMCEVDLIAWTWWNGFKDLKNVSLSEIHHSLLYGFDIVFCPGCMAATSSSLSPTKWEKFMINLSGPEGIYVLVPLAILVFIIAGVSLPVTIIFGFAVLSVLWLTSSLVLCYEWANTLGYEYNILNIALLVGSLAIVVCFIAALNILVAITVGFVGALAVLILFLVGFYTSSGVGAQPKFIFTGVFSTMVIFIPRIIICPLAMWFLIYKFRRRRLSTFDAIESYLQGDNRLAPIRYTYSDIKKMTKNFQEKLGEGGYGSVYKGKLRSDLHVAVKLLGKDGASGQDFMNEIATIGRIHHINVVKLVGYCAQGSKRALVYDFMPNGSLEKYLFNREKMNSLNWGTKFEIAVGAARGIQYLHQGCDVRILHFDIKPHNILLDHNFVPKISDFGLAKFFSTDKHAVTMTACRGTIGYVAPELINRSIGAVSYKADVYSFGMLLVEMVNLKIDLIGSNDDRSQYFPYWIYDCFKQGKDIEMLKAIETDGDDSMMKLARKMTIVALWCIQMNPNDRPSMNKVLEMLEGDVERLQIPNYPSESTQIVVNWDQSGTASSTGSVSLPYHDAVSQPSVEIIVEEL